MAESSLEKFYFNYLQPSLRGKLDLLLARKIFLLACSDYFKKKISLGDLEYISIQIFYDICQPPDFYNNASLHETGNALDSASDITYYFQNKDKKDSSKKTYEARLETIRIYFEKNKHLLTNS